MENGIYLVISLILLTAVVFLVYDVFMTFIELHDNLTREIVEIIDKTLLILMVVEILYTIRVSVKEHTLCADAGGYLRRQYHHDLVYAAVAHLH